MTEIIIIFLPETIDFSVASVTTRWVGEWVE